MKKNIETILIHGGIPVEEKTGAVNVPIYQTSTYKQDELGKHRGYEYSRTGNPTREALEKLIADLEGGIAGFAFASGLAAVTTVLSLFKSGDKILIPTNVYGGTYRLLSRVFSNFNINFGVEDLSDVSKLEEKITPDVKAILLESPTNPLLEVNDIKAVSDIAKKHGLLTIVDNTFLTPYIQRPLELGADIVIHSATKYLGGHCDLIAGLVVVNSEELKEKIAFLQNSIGAILEPFDSFLLIRGIKTLGVRMDRIVENAEYAVDFLLKNDGVKNVYYPNLKNTKNYEINKKQAKNGGGMISFGLKDGYDINKFFKSLKLIHLAESLGGVESLVCHPSSMTHAAMPEDLRQKVGITDGLIRLSVGIEHKEDIVKDLEQAISEAKNVL
ncbi:aminotransferase class I/II-fold pyridoxal phosphate-dependent enzyme [bacterium]|nr:aminotransferase class I/II-fold pyridoxal phosphate-dependent enzyme [bacterium]